MKCMEINGCVFAKEPRKGFNLIIEGGIML